MAHAFNFSTQQAERQVHLCVFEASVIYVESSEKHPLYGETLFQKNKKSRVTYIIYHKIRTLKNNILAV